MLINFVVLYCLNVCFVCAFPAKWIQRIAESNNFDDFENYLPKFGSLPKFQYSTDNKPIKEDVTFEKHSKTNKDTDNFPKSLSEEISDVAEFLREGAGEGYEMVKTFFKENSTTTESPETTTFESSDTFNTNKSNVEITINLNDTIFSFFGNNNTIKTEKLELVENNSTILNDTNRFPRQEDFSNTTESVGGSFEEKENSSGEKESQIDESSEEDGNMVTSLLGAFLGGLSRPDGSIDLEAITGLLGSLSTQNPDGSYDFSGLTELLMSFLGGGGDDGGGGSDVAGFLGGLIGAVLKGTAQNPPGGPKGIGLFTGRLVGGLIPALSGPQPTAEASTTEGPLMLDSGSFLGGLVKGVLQGSGFGGLADTSGGLGSGSSGGTGQGGGGGSKFPVIKAVVSMITSLFTSSSGNKF